MSQRPKKKNSPGAAVEQTGAVSASLQIKYRALDSLIPYERNPRTHTEDQIAQIAASIKEFGFTNPILLDGKNGVIAGHGRLAAARLLGLNKVPCIDLGHLTPEQKRSYLIADNKIAQNGLWNEEFLRLELKELKELGANLELLGFNPMEIADITLGKDVDFKEYDESAADDVETITCRHTMALDLLQAGVDRSVIALWLGHESVETTQIYLEATLAMKERALAKTAPLNGKQGRYQPGDQLLGFLNSL